MIKVISLYNGKWIIEPSQLCYTLSRKTVPKKEDQEPRYTTEGYFSTIPEAVKRVYEKEVMDGMEQDHDLKSAIAEMWAISDRTVHEVQKAIKERSDDLSTR